MFHPILSLQSDMIQFSSYHHKNASVVIFQCSNYQVRILDPTLHKMSLALKFIYVFTSHIIYDLCIVIMLLEISLEEFGQSTWYNWCEFVCGSIVFIWWFECVNPAVRVYSMMKQLHWYSNPILTQFIWRCWCCSKHLILELIFLTTPMPSCDIFHASIVSNGICHC